MKRRVCLGLIIQVLLCLSLSGCTGDDILEEIPRDFAAVSAEGESLQEDVADERYSGELAAEDCSDTLKITDFLREDSYEYARKCLNGTEQLWYDDIKMILGSYGEKVFLNEAGVNEALDETDIDRIFQYVLNDHPELFYVEGYSYTKYKKGDAITALEFTGTYSMDKETAADRYRVIEAAVREVLSGLDEGADQYTKVKYVYERIIRDTDYDLSAPDNQNIYSVFVNHRSVCQGYAKAVQYLLNRLGVESALVLGTVDTGEGHAWNLVKIDGSYYYLDATWGDASYRTDESDGTGGTFMPEINYDYLNVTTAELLKTHRLGENCLPMPACVATEANYYFREGALFSGYDKEQMKALFDKAKEQGKSDITVKCADEESYHQVMSALIGNQEIFDYLDDADGKVAYAQNDNQLSLTFWVTNE